MQVDVLIGCSGFHQYIETGVYPSCLWNCSLWQALLLIYYYSFLNSHSPGHRIHVTLQSTVALACEEDRSSLYAVAPDIVSEAFGQPSWREKT